MRVRVWRYDVAERTTADVESAYGREGEWARLFARSPGHLGTELYREVGTPGRYVTIDRFADAVAWQMIQRQHGDDYAALDEATSRLTVSEEEIVDTDVP